MARRRRFVLCAPVVARPAPADPLARAPTPADADALAALMVDAYRGTIDDDGETPDDAREAVQDLFDGDFGALQWAVSEVVERDGRVVAATLITRWEERPFVAFTMTAPGHQRQGLARAGLVRAINRLAAAGETVLRLMVTQGNTRAEALYESLGFRPEAQPPFTSP
jgi:RimJ/RimL family protein N-acetyltransferase